MTVPKKTLGSVVVLGLLLFWSGAIWAEDNKPDAVAASAASAAAAVAKARELPAYFKAENTDPKKPTWPDPTGAATGVAATPAGDGKGDVPASATTSDLYDRIAHNLFSINMVWALVARLPGHVHASRLRHGGDRPVPGEELLAYVSHESYDLSAGLHLVSGFMASQSAGATGTTALFLTAWYSVAGTGHLHS